MIAKRKRILVWVTCALIFSSCTYIIESMIYGGRTRTCYLLYNYYDTISVYSGSGAYFNDAYCDCDEAAAESNNFPEDFVCGGGDYTCDCYTERNEDDEYDY